MRFDIRFACFEILFNARVPHLEVYCVFRDSVFQSVFVYEGALWVAAECCCSRGDYDTGDGLDGAFGGDEIPEADRWSDECVGIVRCGGGSKAASKRGRSSRR